MGCGCSSTSAYSPNAASKSSESAPVTQAPVDLPQAAGLVDLLGPSLLSKSGSLTTADAIAGRAAVALYFSAHWCPPCKAFTPQLANWYTSNLKAKGLEIVFVSSDHDSSAFQSYYKEMPWLALPFADRARKEALSRRFKVQGIPTLVILDADGKVITKDGRAAVSSDPKGSDFPWRPKSLQEVLAGAKIVGQQGQEVPSKSLENKFFALYFSAHWCPPCRGFTPQLVEWYTKSLKERGLEVVFVSSDRDEKSFEEYFAEMPWLALDYSDRKRKDQLSNMFGVNGIPALVIIGSDGQLITKEGRAAVTADPLGSSFPWYPKPVADLKTGPGCLQDVPTFIAFCEGCTPEEQEKAASAMTPLAQRFLDEQKSQGSDEPQCAFAIATMAGGIAARVRELMSLPIDAQVPRLMLIDIPDDGAFYSGPEGAITADSVTKFVADYEAKALQRQQLKKC